MDNLNDKRKINILIIEDNLADSRMIQELLNEFNTKTKLYTVRNGVEALKFLNKKEKYQHEVDPDLILLDLNIPLIDGFEVLKEIRTNKILNHIPVLVLTTSNCENDFLKAQKLQADCFITKPLDYDEYNKLLKHVEECWLKVKSSNK